jgi:hypothetical protein
MVQWFSLDEGLKTCSENPYNEFTELKLSGKENK